MAGEVSGTAAICSRASLFASSYFVVSQNRGGAQRIKIKKICEPYRTF